MGAGRAAGFDSETTDVGSVRGRSSGPVEAIKASNKLQQMTTNTPDNRQIRISTSCPQGPSPGNRQISRISRSGKRFRNQYIYPRIRGSRTACLAFLVSPRRSLLMVISLDASKYVVYRLPG